MESARPRGVRSRSLGSTRRPGALHGRAVILGEWREAEGEQRLGRVMRVHGRGHLALVAAAALIAAGLTLVEVASAPRLLLGLLAVLFLPGYSVCVALFPRRDD